MAQLFKQAIIRGAWSMGALWAGSCQPAWVATAALDARPLSSLLSLRSFHQQPPHFQQSTAADALPESSSATPKPGRAGPQPPPPWTPTRDLAKRKTLPKRMGHLLQMLEEEKQEEAQAAKTHPDFRPGNFLELKLSVPENKRRTTVFKGICIARRNRGWRTSFTVRNFVGNNGGIERTFPLYSPHLLEVKVLDVPGRKRYRRSKLYFLRDVQPKEYRVA